VNRHAVVVGGGYGGLLAARVLSDHFDRVTVLEQDQVTADTGHHSGVPQSRHPHAMLARGADILERLFPGIRAELAELGAPVIDFGESAALLLPTGWAPRVAIGIPVQTFTRAALERCIRRRVMALPRVELRGGFKVEGLCRDGARVTGVTGRVHGRTVDGDRRAGFDAESPRRDDPFRSGREDCRGDSGGREPAFHPDDLHGRFPGGREDCRGDSEAQEPRFSPRRSSRPGPSGRATVDGELVVYAAGRTSGLAAWLTDIGFPPPAPLVVDGGITYASRLYSDGHDGDWSGTMEYTYAPHVRRGGVLVTVEGGRRLIGLIGAAGECVPNDEAGFLAFARGMRNPLLAEHIAEATPAGPIYRMTRLDNRWTPFHRMRRWPDRLICLGDAICALNPVYGQGMTVAGMQALILADLLDGRGTDLDGLAERFQRRAARSLHLPWLMATSSDRNWNPEQAPPAARAAQWYFGRILELLPEDTDIFRRFFLAAHMIRPPTVLMHPRVIRRTLIRHKRPVS
jgi:2-polyprenyl-6-methoxyphenol hydroxylase-like FAD-dependent oxidoreductase